MDPSWVSVDRWSLAVPRDPGRKQALSAALLIRIVLMLLVLCAKPHRVTIFDIVRVLWAYALTILTTLDIVSRMSCEVGLSLLLYLRHLQLISGQECFEFILGVLSLHS
jgi:hypothetical protein